MMRTRFAVGSLLLCASALSAQQTDDPYLWLEDVEGARPLAWVKAHDDSTIAALGNGPVYQQAYDRTLQVLNSHDRIAYPSIMGNGLSNFWQDAEHPRGIWRSTTWDSYLSGQPQWHTLLDVDSLAAAEDVPWSFHGANCLPPEETLCLVNLSRGGADAVQIREFDTRTGRFVDGGFTLPEAKQDVAWLNHDAILVATDFGPGSMTTSGYARIAKLWRRGTPLTSARTLFEGKETDVSVGVGSVRTADRTFAVVSHSPRFFEAELFVLQGDSLVKLDLPLDSDADMVGDRLVVYLRSAWDVGGRSYSPGSLIATGLDDFLDGERDFQLVLKPGERATIDGVRTTRDHLLVDVLDNVRPELIRYRYDDGRWSADTSSVPDFGSMRVVATSPTTNRYFYSFSGFTQPATLYLATEDGTAREVARMPAQFDATGLVTEQHEATSKDGTKVPYFVVHESDAVQSGNNPTLLYGYGGFEISMLPSYNPVMGASWLANGGTYVLANIRGGGEFGPSWHRVAMKEHRQLAYNDFIAVAEDLIARRVTSPAHLGIMGGSNGGLLMGVMLTERPDLWNAVVIRNPLLDMKRYSHLLAGASWMAEYGDPDTDDWSYISHYSPYQNLKADADYPRPFITTTTRDDRVHPGHARKFAAKLAAQGHPMYFFENTEGGHGAGVTNEQRAREEALIFSYLWKRLGEDGKVSRGGT